MHRLSVSLPDVEATECLGALLAAKAERGDIFFLHGELGAGKTALSRGFLRSFFQNAELDVPSPTYLLHFVYQQDAPVEGATVDTLENEKKIVFKAGRFANLPGVAVHHLDPYRLPVGKIAALVDFEKLFREDISLIEWPERLGPEIQVPGKRVLHVHLSGVGVQAGMREARLEQVDGSGNGNGVGEGVDVGTAGISSWSDRLGSAVDLASQIAEWKRQAAVAAGKIKPFVSTAASSTRHHQIERKSLIVLGIESSCDDTGCAIVTGDGKILGETVASQAGIHEVYGGVKPDAAQQAHKKAIHDTVQQTIDRAKEHPSGLFTGLSDVSAIAVTVGPGLGLCLGVGVEKAVSLACELQKPLVRIHHMEAHAMMTRMPMKEGQVIPDFPYLTLLVSGGHNMVVLTEGLGQHRILGSTLDDSVGEAFDKTSRLLGITQIPGGPWLEKLAKKGDDRKYHLPKPLCNSRDHNLKTGCDFSYSGLKTGVKALIEKHCPLKEGVDAQEDDEQARADVAAAFQRVAVAHLVERTERAIGRAQEFLREKHKKSKTTSSESDKEKGKEDDGPKEVKTLIVAGGVAANGLVRAEVSKLAGEKNLEILIPPPKYCVDNGVMVAWTGVERFLKGLHEEPPKSAENVRYFCETRPRWPLGERDGKSNNFKERISKEMKAKAGKLGKTGVGKKLETGLEGGAGNSGCGGSAPMKRPGSGEEDAEEQLSKRAQKRLKKAEILAERKAEGAAAAGKGHEVEKGAAQVEKN
eukprot:g2813.t1